MKEDTLKHALFLAANEPIISGLADQMASVQLLPKSMFPGVKRPRSKSLEGTLQA